MMKFKGYYELSIPITTMFLNTKIKIHHKNIITTLGESFFLHRAIDDEYKPIQYIVLGKSNNRARKNDLQLGQETIRKKCIKRVELDKQRLRLTVSFTAKELMGTKEIGVHNGDVLITHDIYDDLPEEVVSITTSEITVDYYIELSTGAIRNTDWQLSTGKTFTYYLVEPNTVMGVIESNTRNGYTRVNSIDEVETTKNSYYYDDITKNLYIRPSTNRTPSTEDIIILTR